MTKGPKVVKLYEKSLDELRTLFEERVKKNFPGKWPLTELCGSVKCQLYIEDITQPFALIILGPPSNYKTTVLNFYDGMSDSYRSDRFTPRSFVSHSASVKKEDLPKVDLLPRIKDKCFITPELAPVFGASEEVLLDNISILTRVLDGQGYTGDSGVHGQRGYPNPHMFVWLAAIVEIPYRAWKLIGNLGSRLYFRREPATAERTEDTEVEELEDQAYMERLDGCRKVCHEYLLQLKIKWDRKADSKEVRKIKWDRKADPKEVRKIIVRLAKLLARLRATINIWETEGSGGSEYNFTTPNIENPDRARNALYNLARGHALFNGRSQISYEDLPIIIDVTLSSAPKERSMLFQLLLEKQGEMTTLELESALNVSKMTARKTMKELLILGLVDEMDIEAKTRPIKSIRIKDDLKWFLTKEFRDITLGTHTPAISILSPMEEIENPIPENNIEKKGTCEPRTPSIISEEIKSKQPKSIIPKIERDFCPICGPGNYTDWEVHCQAFHRGSHPCEEEGPKTNPVLDAITRILQKHSSVDIRTFKDELDVIGIPFNDANGEISRLSINGYVEVSRDQTITILKPWWIEQALSQLKLYQMDPIPEGKLSDEANEVLSRLEQMEDSP